ncbi:MAG: hypothetical protein AB7N76_21170 [Planctomycetota bacterium]
MQISFSIYLASKTRWAHLQKEIDLASVPRAGDYVKLENARVGDSPGGSALGRLTGSSRS